MGRRIGHLDYAVYGPSRAKVKHLPWISHDDSMEDLPQARWIAAQLTRDRSPLAQVVVNDSECILQCVKAGLGKSLLPVAIAEREPGLRRLSDEVAPVSRELWVMVHPELRNMIRIRVAIDWLVSVVAAR